MLLMDEFRCEIELEKKAIVAAIQKIDKHLLGSRTDRHSIILPKLVSFLKNTFN